MSVLRSGGRGQRWAWRKIIASPGGVDTVGPMGDGTPQAPGTGRVIPLNWEILMPAIVHGTSANWFTTYPQFSNPTTNLPLFSFYKGMANLGSFTKHNLVILDFKVFMGSVVTDVNASYATSSIQTDLIVNDGGSGLTARRWTTWPGSAPSNPNYTYLGTPNVDVLPVLLSSTYPDAYLKITNTHGSIDTAAGRIRCFMQVAEI